MKYTQTQTRDPFSSMSARMTLVAFTTAVFSLTLAVSNAPGKDLILTAAGHPAEGNLESFLGESKLDIQQVYTDGRFPNILVAVDGSLLALWAGVKVRRSEDGGQTGA